MKKLLIASIFCCGFIVTQIGCVSLQGSQEKGKEEARINNTGENLPALIIALSNQQLDEDIQMDDARYGYGDGSYIPTDDEEYYDTYKDKSKKEKTDSNRSTDTYKKDSDPDSSEE